MIEPLADLKAAAPCVHCGHAFNVHRRHAAPPDVAAYVPCTVCECPGYAHSDPWPATNQT